ncbi:MAG: hypothetical protein H7328_07510 [Bdellovibrio sp.]|nr:hypothetical protein [Bdellovibrio sp.]
MKSVLIALTIFSSAAFAETTTFTVEGMHCSGCKHMISEKVCKNEKLTADIESCNVSITNMKKQTGKVVLVSKKDKKIDLAEAKKSISAAGEEYKVTKEETK